MPHGTPSPSPNLKRTRIQARGPTQPERLPVMLAWATRDKMPNLKPEDYYRSDTFKFPGPSRPSGFLWSCHHDDPTHHRFAMAKGKQPSLCEQTNGDSWRLATAIMIRWRVFRRSASCGWNQDRAASASAASERRLGQLCQCSSWEWRMKQLIIITTLCFEQELEL